MDRQQIDLVRSSFALVQPIAPAAAAMFYDQLFAADPSLRPLFTGDMARHGQRLMAAIGAAVGMLEQPAQLQSMLRQLGARHAGYGAKAVHYETVGGALLATLQQGLGDAFTPQTHAAWAQLYAVVSGAMMDGAREAAAETSAA